MTSLPVATGGNAPRPTLIAYPFPLADGQMGRLELPRQGLTPADAERLVAFVRSLTVGADSEAGT